MQSISHCLCHVSSLCVCFIVLLMVNLSTVVSQCERSRRDDIIRMYLQKNSILSVNPAVVVQARLSLKLDSPQDNRTFIFEIRMFRYVTYTYLQYKIACFSEI